MRHRATPHTTPGHRRSVGPNGSTYRRASRASSTTSSPSISFSLSQSPFASSSASPAPAPGAAAHLGMKFDVKNEGQQQNDGQHQTTLEVTKPSFSTHVPQDANDPTHDNEIISQFNDLQNMQERNGMNFYQSAAKLVLDLFGKNKEVMVTTEVVNPYQVEKVARVDLVSSKIRRDSLMVPEEVDINLECKEINSKHEENVSRNLGSLENKNALQIREIEELDTILDELGQGDERENWMSKDLFQSFADGEKDSPVGSSPSRTPTTVTASPITVVSSLTTIQGESEALEMGLLSTPPRPTSRLVEEWVHSPKPNSSPRKFVPQTFKLRNKAPTSSKFLCLSVHQISLAFYALLLIATLHQLEMARYDGIDVSNTAGLLCFTGFIFALVMFPQQQN